MTADEPHFLFSSENENPDHFFQGYCFIGSDYIYGEHGASSYRDKTGNPIPPGQDGCYVVAERERERESIYSFFSDCYGYRKVFYYWTPEIWVVSNSVLKIAELLLNNGIRLHPNLSQLRAIGILKTPLFNQLYTLNTFVKGIKLLPLGARLTISKSKLSIQPYDTHRPFNNYEQGLSFYLSTWIARIGGWLKNGVQIKSDLTGGADSRAVFTLLHKACEVYGIKENRPTLNSGLHPRAATDLAIASQIAGAYGYPLNKRILLENRYSGRDSYNAWKNLCLGVYHPVYFPTRGPQSGNVSMGGGGAENHRPFYKFKDTASLIESHRRHFGRDDLAHEFTSEISEEFQRLQQIDPLIDPLILHYRAYRNRMHVGRTSQYTTLISPLGSSILEDVSNVAGSERIRNGQINYDIMATLLPSILEVPFDSDSKSFNATRKQNLTLLSDLEVKDAGNVFGTGSPTGNDIRPTKTASALEYLREDFLRSKNKPFAQDFFGADYIRDAGHTMEEAIGNGNFSHAVEAQGIVAIIASSLFD